MGGAPNGERFDLESNFTVRAQEIGEAVVSDAEQGLEI
jgi:hypothetical protein